MSEIVLIIGNLAAGKTSLVKKYTDQGYHRVNRDLLGGNLDGLCTHVEKAVKDGVENIVMDNTYASIESRKSIVDCGKKLKIPVRVEWLTTSFEEAQFNACTRMVRKHGRLLTPDEMKKTKDPNDFPPAALFNYKKTFQKPTTVEGFSKVEQIPFIRVKDPTYCNKALILDYDDTLRFVTGSEQKYPTDPSHVNILPGRIEVLQEYKDNGYLLLGISNQSGVAKKILTDEQARACFDRTNELLGFEIDYVYCPHNIPPVVCYCRKPAVGNMVVLIERYKLDVSKCLFVGDQTTDATCSQRCNIPFMFAKDFFK